MLAYTDPVEINGIYYNLVNKSKTAEVVQDPSISLGVVSYKGNIIIPKTVTYEGVVYTVTSIGNSAFQVCRDLSSITIPNTVTSIGDWAFQDCGLASVTIPNSVTSLGAYAFDECKSLTSVIISNNIKTIYGAFRNCINLTSVIIPESVTKIDSEAFSYCSSLQSITIPNNVTVLSNASFDGCTSLESVIIPNSVTVIGPYVFKDCISLNSVIIPNSVTQISYNSFQNCSNLTVVEIPNSVTIIGQYAFDGCKKLTKLTLGNGLITIYDKAFAQCSELTDVYSMAEKLTVTPNFSNLYTKTNAFDGSLIEYATLHIPESAINDYKDIEPWCNFGVIKTLTGEELNKCATPTIIIEDGKIKFYCETEGVDFISNVSTIDEKDYYDAELNLTYVYKVTVYAQKDGYKNSDIATAEFMSTGIFGDLNGDGTVNVADHVKLTEIIMNQK